MKLLRHYLTMSLILIPKTESQVNVHRNILMMCAYTLTPSQHVVSLVLHKHKHRITPNIPKPRASYAHSVS